MRDKKTALSCGNTRGQKDMENSFDEMLVRLKILTMLQCFEIGVLLGLVFH